MEDEESNKANEVSHLRVGDHDFDFHTNSISINSSAFYTSFPIANLSCETKEKQEIVQRLCERLLICGIESVIREASHS